MKLTLRAATLAAAAVLSSVPAMAVVLDLGTNITISDGNSSSGVYGPHEDNETETNPATIATQVWDLEGMFMNGTQLTMVGGYDFRDGVLHGGRNYDGGHLFIDVNGDAVYGAANHGSGTSSSNATVLNSFGYDFVLTLDYVASTFTVLQINAASLVSLATDVSSSNPWRYVSGGTAVASGSLSYYENVTNGEVLGWNGNNSHYAVSLDSSFLSSLAPGSTATWHYTMECGNDNLMGRSAVPDAATTLSLFGMALVGLAGFRRRVMRA